MQNYYELLEVSSKASPEVIKKVFKFHIKQNHPDLFQGEAKAKAENKIKEINEAYEILSNEDKRKQYDIMLEEKVNEEVEQPINYEEENINLRKEISYKDRLLSRLSTYFTEDEFIGILNEQEISYKRDPKNININNSYNNEEYNNDDNCQSYNENNKINSTQGLFSFMKRLLATLIFICVMLFLLYLTIKI